ncbi:hypothetical protein NIA69_20860 [Gemmiger formicilis]|nr:hypothetical protein [Gemmiger formicilis]
MSQEEKKQTAPETEAAAEKPETPHRRPLKRGPQAEEKNEGKHDCKHHHHETAALQASWRRRKRKTPTSRTSCSAPLPSMTTTASAPSARLTRSSTTVCPTL